MNSDKAYKLREDLEALSIFKVLKRTDQPKGELSEKHAGALHLTHIEYQQLQEAVTQSPNEWEKDV